MKESSIHKIYTARFLMPDRGLDSSVKPSQYEMLYLD